MALSIKLRKPKIFIMHAHDMGINCVTENAIIVNSKDNAGRMFILVA